MRTSKRRKLKENGVGNTSATTLFHDDLRKIIEPFTHEQLSQIVLTASIRHPDVLDAVRSVADRDPTQRKLFIRGLGWETTTEKLRALFATYGDLEEAIVILDKVTGMSKGYGFVTYKHIDGALMALKEPSKKIDGRITVATLASSGLTGGVTVGANSQTLDVSSRRIYVGNVPYDMPGERLLAHFSSYGELEEGPLGFDKTTGKSRGYALFIYKNVEGARASLVDPIKTIDGHQLNCKVANDGKKGNATAVAAPVPKHGQVLGSGNGGKPEEVNLNQQSSIQGSFGSLLGGGGPGGIPAYGGNLGGLGIPGGPGGISSYDSGAQGPPFGVSQLPQNLNLGSFGSNGGGSRLLTNGSQVPVSLGVVGGFSLGLGSGGYGGSHFGGPGASAGGTISGGGVGIGTGFGGSGQKSHHGLLPGSMRIGSGGYPESAHYSLSSGSAYQTQLQHKTGMPPITRVPTGGAYQGPPYK